MQHMLMIGQIDGTCEHFEYFFCSGVVCPIAFSDPDAVNKF